MQVDCPECGATLQLNPNLAGTALPCPQCGAVLTVPKPPREAPPAPAPAPAATPAPTPRRRRAARLELEPEPAPAKGGRPMAPLTIWLIGAQASLAVLGLSCLAGAFFAGRWNPPEWSYFRESAMFLVPAGVGLLVLGWMASYLPVLAALIAAVFVMCACAHSYVVAASVDASRTLALMVAMFALWCALQHRRATTDKPA